MESRYGIGINNRYAFFLDEDGDGEDLGMLPKKPVGNSKTPAEAPEVDSKSVKKNDPADKKAITKDSKPTSREGKKDF